MPYEAGFPTVLQAGFAARILSQPQRWESLGNLGAVKSDAAGIAYAVERGWLRISGGLHSLSLTEDGRQRLK